MTTLTAPAQTDVNAIDSAAVAMANRNPQLAQAAFKGATLVIYGHVELFQPPVNNCVATVASSNGAGRYEILTTGDGLTCECPHFTFGNPPAATVAGREQRFCKHIAAYFIARKTR